MLLQGKLPLKQKSRIFPIIHKSLLSLPIVQEKALLDILRIAYRLYNISPRKVFIVLKLTFSRVLMESYF